MQSTVTVKGQATLPKQVRDPSSASSRAIG